MSVVSLSEMKIGQSGIVEELADNSSLGQRLLEMGITRGTEVQVIRFAPLGDPIDIKIRGYHLSLRKKESEVIRVSLKN